jgi:hypothetical protein
VIEKVPLSRNTPVPTKPSFPFAHDPRERFVAGKVKQQVDVIGHQNCQVAIPDAAIMTIAYRFDDDRSGDRIAEMVNTSGFGACGDEEVRFRSNPYGRFMIQTFAGD